MMVGFGVFGLVFMILLLGGLIFGGVWLAQALFWKNTRRQGFMPQEADWSPEEILERRYARGDISREEYEILRADLQG